jgi:hypothetical protein
MYRAEVAARIAPFRVRQLAARAALSVGTVFNVRRPTGKQSQRRLIAPKLFHSRVDMWTGSRHETKQLCTCSRQNVENGCGEVRRHRRNDWHTGLMPLFQRRQREAQRAASPPKLTEAIPNDARAKIFHALEDHIVPDSHAVYGYGRNVTDWMVLNEELKQLLAREWGVLGFPHDDIRAALGNAEDRQVLDMVEAWYPATERVVKCGGRE